MRNFFRSSGTRVLRVENLEQRQLLSVSPAMPAPEASVQAETVEAGSSAYGLPYWRPPAAQAVVVTDYLYDQTVYTEWWDAAEAAQGQILAMQPWTALNEMSFTVDGHAGSIESATLMVDMTGHDNELVPDGYFETEVSDGQISGDNLVFTVESSWGLAIPENGLPYQVKVTFEDDAMPGEYQLTDMDVAMSSAYGRVSVSQFGYDSPIITVEELAELEIGINGPSSQTVAPFTDDVNLGNIVFDSSEALDVYSLPILIDGQVAEGVQNSVENVQLCDVETGQVYDAVADPYGTFEGSQVYTVDSFTLPVGDHEFMIRADVTNVSDGDTIRASVLNGVEIGNEWFDPYARQQDEGGYVEVSPDGIIEGPWHTVVEESSPTGALFVREHTTEIPSSQQLLGGTLSEPVLRLEMEALYENVDVTYVGINVEGSTDSIHRFELFRAHEEEPFAFATRGGSAIGDDFGARLVNQEFVCAESTYPDIIVRARTRTDMEGGVSGQDVTVALGGIEARGFTSNNVLSQNDGDGTIDEGEILIGLPYSEIGSNQQIIGQPNVTVMSKIVDIQNASVDAHGSAIPIGNSPICEFKFTAADHINFKHGSNDVVLDGIIYTVSATNVLLATDGLALYNKSDQTTVVDTYTLYATDGTEITGDTATGTILVMFDGLHDSVVNTEIDRGDSETFVLEANIINTSIDPRFGSALQVGLQRFNQIDSVFGVTGDANDSHISWLDYDAQPVTPRFDWIEHRETVIKGTSYNDGVPTASELPLAESYPPEPFTWSAETAKKKREAAADHFFEMMI